MKGFLNLMLALGAETVAAANAHHPNPAFIPLFFGIGLLAALIP